MTHHKGIRSENRAEVSEHITDFKSFIEDTIDTYKRLSSISGRSYKHIIRGATKVRRQLNDLLVEVEDELFPLSIIRMRYFSILSQFKEVLGKN